MGRHHLAQPEPGTPWSYRPPVLNAPEHLRQPTLPWHPEQYARVNGYAVVYTHDRDGLMVVRLPGGEALTVAQILARGWVFEAPRWLRTESYA
jgi:hypothetical protein